MTNSKRYLHISICLAASFLVLQPAWAAEMVNGVEPRVGKASGTIGAICESLLGEKYTKGYSYAVSVTFWNIGKLGGDQYKALNMNLTGLGDTKACVLGGTGLTSVFDGGPNGKVAGNGALWQMRLVDGRAFELTYKGYSAMIPVEDPSIFDGWVDEKYQTLYSGAGFSDLAGMVEVNIPLPDGTYDPENWSYAKIKEGQNFPVGTHIRTGKDSHAILSFYDMSTFTVQPESEVVLSSPYTEGGTKVVLKMIIGNMWTNIKKMAKDGSMQVEMSQAVAGIKGTTFVTAETGTTSTLKVIEGTVSFTSKATGDTESVSTGEMMTADKNGLGAKTTFDVAKEQADRQTAQQKIETKTPAKNYLPYYIGGGVLLALVSLTLFFLRRKK